MMFSTDGSRRMAQAVDLVHRRALEPDRRDVLSADVTAPTSARAFLDRLAGRELARRGAVARGADPRQHRARAQLRAAGVPGRPGARPGHRRMAVSQRARDAEGKLSQRLNALVSRADVRRDRARDIGTRHHIRLGKQARDDGGARQRQYSGRRDGGAARRQLRRSAASTPTRDHRPRAVGRAVDGRGRPAQASQVGACRNGPPATGASRPNTRWSTARARTTPRASPLRLTVNGVGEAEATASSKQEAETGRRRRQFMERHSHDRRHNAAASSP